MQNNQAATCKTTKHQQAATGSNSDKQEIFKMAIRNHLVETVKSKASSGGVESIEQWSDKTQRIRRRRAVGLESVERSIERYEVYIGGQRS